MQILNSQVFVRVKRKNSRCGFNQKNIVLFVAFKLHNMNHKTIGAPGSDDEWNEEIAV